MRRLWRNQDGNVALLAALVLPLIMLAAAVGIDFQRGAQQRERLKDAADALALRGANELLLASATPDKIKAVIDAAVAANFGEQFGLQAFSHAVEVNAKEAEVTVSLKQTAYRSLFSGLLGARGDLTLSSTAVAQGGAKVCVVALEETERDGVRLDWKASLSASDCSVLSNSTSQYGVSATSTAKLTTGLTCSSGGYSGSSLNFDPVPTTDCPAYPDPLAKREAPPITGDVYTDVVVGERSVETFFAALKQSAQEYEDATGTQDDVGDDDDDSSSISYTKYTLSPGIYRGGLTIASNADVTLESGLYIIQDGPLVVDMGAKLNGENVSFYLVGDKSTFLFGPDSKISLTAQKEGPLAGILFFEDRAAPEGRKHVIASDDARVLLGTFYLPRGDLVVSSLLPVADKSAYTVIVARRLALSGSPTLVLNTDYASTDVPVPEGVGLVGGSIRLRE
jgi:Flp pilus assembly protein TadG